MTRSAGGLNGGIARILETDETERKWSRIWKAKSEELAYNPKNSGHEPKVAKLRTLSGCGPICMHRTPAESMRNYE